MRKKWMLFFAIGFLSFSACSETDPGAQVIRLGAGITDHVGLESVEAPREASIYLARYKELDFDESAGEILTGTIQEERKDTESVQYARTVPDGDGRAELLSIDYDEGRLDYSVAFVSPEGEVEGYAYSLPQGEGFSEQAQLMEYHHATMKMPEEAGDNETCRQAERLAEGYMDRLGITDYRLRAAAEFRSADQTSTDCYMLWEQVVDDIPVSWLEITDNMDAGRRSVYNSSQGFNHDIRQVGTFGEGTRMVMHVTDGRLTDLEVCLVEPTEPYATRRIITAERAFRLVEEVYEQKGENTDPRLELAELQYKCLEQDGQIYLYPVWVFGIAEYDAAWAESDKDAEWRNQWLSPGDYYHYYIIDVFSGELLLDPQLE